MSFNTQQHHQSNDEESTIFRSIPMGSAAAMRPLPPMMKPVGLRPLPAGKLSLPSKPIMAPHAVAAPPKSTVSINWKVDGASIPSVPEYPLERTHMSCPASLSVDQITERIARVLEANNLECAFKDDEDSCDSTDEEFLHGRLDCTSGDLKFVIQLWRSHTNEIVVEMQRRRGSSLEFSAIRKPLFQTLQTGTLAAKKKTFSPPAFTPNKKFRVLPPSMAAMPPMRG